MDTAPTFVEVPVHGGGLVVAQWGTGPNVVVADLRPDLVERLVLVDGGLPLPFALDDIDPDVVLEVTLGPALERLKMTFESVEAYVDFWRGHPALAGDWHDDLEAYVRYDLTGEAPALRSRVDDEAVRADGRDLFVNGAKIIAARIAATPSHQRL